MNKKIDLKVVAEKVKMIRRVSNLGLTAYFITGYPGETASEILQTLRLAKSLPFDRAEFSGFTPHPGTPIARQLDAQGKLKNIVLLTYNYHQISMGTGSLSRNAVKALQLWSFFSFYIRPRILCRFLRQMGNPFGLKTIVYKLIALSFPILRKRVPH